MIFKKKKEEKEEVQRCIECGKILKDKTYAPYCKECDEKLDRQFDLIEDNITIYRDILDSELEILKKFDDEDIKDLFRRVYVKFSGEKGGLKRESIIVLGKLKNSFGLNETKMGLSELPDIKNIKSADACPECGKRIKEDFNFCPYCGYKLKE